jgi:hypothetical protein
VTKPWLSPDFARNSAAIPGRHTDIKDKEIRSKPNRSWNCCHWIPFGFDDKIASLLKDYTDDFSRGRFIIDTEDSWSKGAKHRMEKHPTRQQYHIGRKLLPANVSGVRVRYEICAERSAIFRNSMPTSDDSTPRLS